MPIHAKLGPTRPQPVGGTHERAGEAVIREDRELLAELARLNTDMVPLAMRMMEGSATAPEQRIFAQRLIAAGQRLHRRAEESERVVIEGEAVVTDIRSLSADTATSMVCHLRS